MTDNESEAIVRHVKGATVVHRSPFEDIDVPAVDALTQEEIDTWVAPYYRVSFQWTEDDTFRSLKQIYPDISIAVTERLLCEDDWRPRATGAFFAALKKFEVLMDHIGKLLLRSDFCYAGKHYCVALAEFNAAEGLEYLRRYLDHYLTRPELDYDQGDAMGAIAYLDQLNGTHVLDAYRDLWQSYIDAKEYKPDLDDNIERFKKEMAAVQDCRARMEPGS